MTSKKYKKDYYARKMDMYMHARSKILQRLFTKA